MKLYLNTRQYFDTNQPLDLSIGLRNDESNPRAWYVDAPRFEPVRTEHYTGSIAEGGSVNFRDIFFNPHGHGTHTECLGHITETVYSINETLKEYFFQARLITIEPKKIENNGTEDSVITLNQIREIKNFSEALVIRTLPNGIHKKKKSYSATNPTYLEVGIAAFLIEKGVKHLLLDLPSVDREEDEGELAFHHAFWEVPNNPNFERTITELIYVNDSIADGEYILNLHLAPFENDASPSRPVLYRIVEA